MRRLRVAGVCGFAALLLFSAQAGSATAPRLKVKVVAHPVWTLAMDWPRLAYVSGQDRKSESIRVWNVATGVMSAVDGGRSTSAVQYAAGLALSGKRVVWLRVQQSGNSYLYHRLYTAPVGGSAHALTALMRGYDRYMDCGLAGPQMGGLAGSHTAVVVSSWNGGRDGSAPSSQRLAVVTSTARRTVSTGANAILSESTDGGHIAVLPLPTINPDDCSEALPTSVYVYSTAGALLATIALPAADPSTIGYQVAIRGHQLVVLTKGLHEPSGPAWVTLTVYDWTTDTLLNTWPVAIDLYPGEVNFSFYGNVAAVEGWSDLHLVNLNTGKDVVIAPSSQTGCSTALGPQGLVYALNSDTAGRLVFVPTAQLLALVS